MFEKGIKVNCTCGKFIYLGGWEFDRIQDKRLCSNCGAVLVESAIHEMSEMETHMQLLFGYKDFQWLRLENRQTC
jgi:hypothetical protein